MTILLRQALDALETCTPGDYSTSHVIFPSYDHKLVAAATDALRSALAAPQPEPESTSAKYVYLVTWEQDKARCVEAFGDRPSAVAYANNISGALVTCVALRGMDYVGMVFGLATLDGFGGNLDSAFDAPVSGSTDGLSQDYNGKLGKWFSDRLGAREQLRRDMPPAAPAPAVPLTDADIDRIADAVPSDQIDVYITTWHRRFARAVLSAAPAVPLMQPTPRTAGCLMCGHCAATGERVVKPAVPLTDEQVAAGIKAWFTTEIAGKNQPFEGRMRAAYAAINGIGGGGNG